MNNTDETNETSVNEADLFTPRRQVVHASMAGRGRRNTSREATYA
ncbi:MAG: hypothetical protein ACRC2T_09955 [Thermoguttaceae bacterium]